MKKLLSAVTSVAMSLSLMAGAFASSVSAASSLTVEQPNISMDEVLDVSANTFAADGTVEWVIPTVTAAPGQTVTLPIVAKSSSLEVAGGQFTIKAGSPIEFNSITTGDAYGYSIASNVSENTFLFSGVKGKVAAEDSVIGTLKYTVPADCPEGKYDIKWSESTVSAARGINVTSKVKFTDGAINVTKSDADGAIEWVLDNVAAEPGQKVTLKAYVNTNGSSLGVAGGQFVISADSPIAYDSVAEGGAYDAKLAVNSKGENPAFLFSKYAENGVVAADKAEILTLTYVVPTDCPEGKYNVKWSEQTVSNGKAQNITSKVTFKDGSITVKKANTGKIKWVLGNETAQPGDTVKLQAFVDDSSNAAVAVAGGQFTINSGSDKIKLVGASEKSEAYDAAINANIAKSTFLFGKPGSAAVAAKDGKSIITLEFAVDESCAEGTYDIKWADTTVSNALSANINSNVEFVDGTITVSKSAEAGDITWDIEDKTVNVGTTSVKLNAVVKGTSDLAVAGGQFAISCADPVKLTSVTGSPYGAELSKNKDGSYFLFAKKTGSTAKDGDVIVTLEFTLPSDIAEGTYAVSWDDTTVSAEKGVNITSKVKFENGSVTVTKNGETTSTTTTVADSTTTTTTTTKATDVPGSTTTTTKATDVPGSTTTTTKATDVPGSTTTTTTTKATDVPGSTTTTTSTTTAGPVEPTTTTTSATTAGPVEPTTTTTSATTAGPVESTTTTTSATTAGPVESTTTTTTTTTVVPSSTTTTTEKVIVIPDDKTVAWVVKDGFAYPGEEVKINIVVFDPQHNNLAISGAMFDMVAGDDAELVAVGDKSAYGADILSSKDKLRLMFYDGSAQMHSAAHGSVVAELTYKISENATPGTRIPVEITNLSAAGEKSANIASKIYTEMGYITVLDPIVTTTTTEGTDVPGSTTTTTESTDVPGSTTTTTTVSTDVPGSTTTTTTTTKATDVPGSETTTTTPTTVVPGSTTTTSSTSTTTDVPGSTTTTTTTKATDVPGSTTTTTTTKATDVPGSTTTTTTTTKATDVPGSETTTTTPTTVVPGSTTTTSSTSTTTDVPGSTTTTTVTTTKEYDGSYAVIETEAGFYFSHDDGTDQGGNSGGFRRTQVKSLKIIDVFKDGTEVERTDVSMEFINFNGLTPEDVYSAREHSSSTTSLNDFKYDISVYYGDMALRDKDGKPLTVSAYIGVKGDISLNNLVDAVDASVSLRYYAQMSTYGASVSTIKCQTTESGLYVPGADDILDQFAAFLGDVDVNEWDPFNWNTTKDGRLIDAVDASDMLAFFAKRSSQNYEGTTNSELWDEILGTKRYSS